PPSRAPPLSYSVHNSPCAMQADAQQPALRSSPQRWQKVLYVKQPFPDNHVDESFLASLVTNGSFMLPGRAALCPPYVCLALCALLWVLHRRHAVHCTAWSVCCAGLVVAPGPCTAS
ncbi:hypothetical protein EON67_04800, partial [archaeon]